MHEAAATPAWVLLAYLVSGVCFILALRGLSSPESSRRGNYIGMVGMAIAVVTTLITHVPAIRSSRVSAWKSYLKFKAHFSLTGLLWRNPRRDADWGRRRPHHGAQDPDDRDAAAGRRVPQPRRNGRGAGRRGGVP